MIYLGCDKCGQPIEGSEDAIDTHDAGVMRTRAIHLANAKSFDRYRINVSFDKMNSSGGLERHLHLCRECKMVLLGYSINLDEVEWE